MRNGIRVFLPSVYYPVILIISGIYFLIDHDIFMYSPEVRNFNNIIVSMDSSYFISPLQGVVVFIPLFLGGYFIINKNRNIMPEIIEPRFSKFQYFTIDIWLYSIHTLITTLSIMFMAFLACLIHGEVYNAEMITGSFILKFLYCMCLSMILEIGHIFKLKAALWCSVVYIAVAAEFVLTYYFNIIPGILFPYAFFRVDKAISYIILLVSMLGLIVVYILCKGRLQEFLGEKK